MQNFVKYIDIAVAITVITSGHTHAQTECLEGQPRSLCQRAGPQDLHRHTKYRDPHVHVQSVN